MHPPSPPPSLPSLSTLSVSFTPSGRGHPPVVLQGIRLILPSPPPPLRSRLTSLEQRGPPLSRERSPPRRRTGSSMPPLSPMTPLLSRPTLSVALPPQRGGHHPSHARGPDAPAIGAAAASLAADVFGAPPPIRVGPSPNRERPPGAPPRREYASKQDAHLEGRWRRRGRHDDLAPMRTPGAADVPPLNRERPSDAPPRREYAVRQDDLPPRPLAQERPPAPP